MGQKPTSTNRLGNRPRPGVKLFLSVLATLLVAATMAGGVVSASVQSDECFGSGASLGQAKADYSERCSEPRIDCDRLDATWYCSDHVIGDAAPDGNSGPASSLGADDTPEPAPTTTEAPPADDSVPATVAPLDECTAVAGTLRQAKAAYAESCTLPRADCDPTTAGWTCSSGVIGDAAPGAPATTEPPATTTEAPTTTTEAPDDDSLDSLHPDIVKVIDVPGRNPGGAGWADSYSVGDECFCATTFDHNIGGITVETPDGLKTVRDVCEAIGDGPGAEGRPIYNDIQCGNGPPNDAGDEDDCPGRVDIGRDGCGQIGPEWDLSVFRQ